MSEEEKEALETGAFDKADIEYELPSRGKYNWIKVKEAITEGKVWVLPVGTNRNTILTALRRENIDARVGIVKGSDPEQFVIVPT